MPNFRNLFSLFSFLPLILASVVKAADIEPTLPKPYAPLDIRKSKSIVQKPSLSERKEVVSEFGGILYMGLNKISYEKWSGKEMSDCVDGKASDNWCQRCEMITPHANAFYSFYRDSNHKGCTLQEVNVNINVADQTVMKDLKKPIRSIFGQEERTGAAQNPSAYKWQTDSDSAKLYMDGPEGYDPAIIKFNWVRQPLNRTRTASAETSIQPASN